MTKPKTDALLKSFMAFTAEKLGIKKLPSLHYKLPTDQGEQPSFAAYSPHSKEVILQTKNRHPMDVMRSLAHELVHHKQAEDGLLSGTAEEGATGSPHENEANSVAGKIMRWYGKEHPDTFNLGALKESRWGGGAGNFGTAKLTNQYKKDTPGEVPGKIQPYSVTPKLGKTNQKHYARATDSYPGLKIGADRIGAEFGYPKGPTIGTPFSDDFLGTPDNQPNGVLKTRYESNDLIKKYRSKTKLESLTDPFDGTTGTVPATTGNDPVQDKDTNAEFEKMSLFNKKKKKTKTK